MTIDFCLPVFNEEEIIEENVLKLLTFCKKANFEFDWNIIIINNGSKDKTREISLRIKSEKIKYFEIDLAGKGRALKRYWLNSKADILVYMDIDMPVSFSYLKDLVAPIIFNECDLVIGSRRLVNSRYNGLFIRDFVSKLYLYLSRLMLAHNYTDLQCGFKAIRADKFKIVAPYMEDNYWFFDTELIMFLHNLNGRIKELAVNWVDTKYANRKSRVLIIREGVSFFLGLLSLKKRLKILGR